MSRPPGATVGGQAVIEGVMMRAPSAWAVAARRPDGVIEVQSHELPRLSSRSKAARLPFLRGVMVLVESLSLGFRALSWSAQRAGEEDEEITRAQAIGTMVIAAIFAVGLFILLPAFAANWLKRFFDDSSLTFVILDGVLPRQSARFRIQTIQSRVLGTEQNLVAEKIGAGIDLRVGFEAP